MLKKMRRSMILTFDGTPVIKMVATTRQRDQAPSNDTSLFIILTFDGTAAIKKAATTRQREQAVQKVSKHTNRTFMILTFDGTTVIKTDATMRQNKQTASNSTNR